MPGSKGVDRPTVEEVARERRAPYVRRVRPSTVAMELRVSATGIVAVVSLSSASPGGGAGRNPS